MSSLVLFGNRAVRQIISAPILRVQFAAYGSDATTDKPKAKKVKSKKGKTPKGKFDDNYDEAAPSYAEKEPLKKHPGNKNPETGEYGGPSGPEPTR